MFLIDKESIIQIMTQKEKVLYQELAPLLVTPERFSELASNLGQLALEYEVPAFRNGQAGAGQ